MAYINNNPQKVEIEVGVKKGKLEILAITERYKWGKWVEDLFILGADTVITGEAKYKKEADYAKYGDKGPARYLTYCKVDPRA